MEAIVTPDAVNEMVRDHFPGSSNRCLELGADYAVAELITTPESIRPGGFISGPSQFGLADAALWYLVFVAIGRIEPMALTSELSIRFLRPAVGDRLGARATLESRSRRSVIGSVHIWAGDAAHKPTAIAQGTYALPFPQPSG
ncbi:MAG: PaaI family thioesterase [Ilumatobacteraceae bacterium]